MAGRVIYADPLGSALEGYELGKRRQDAELRTFYDTVVAPSISMREAQLDRDLQRELLAMRLGAAASAGGGGGGRGGGGGGGAGGVSAATSDPLAAAAGVADDVAASGAFAPGSQVVAGAFDLDMGTEVTGGTAQQAYPTGSYNGIPAPAAGDALYRAIEGRNWATGQVPTERAPTYAPAAAPLPPLQIARTPTPAPTFMSNPGGFIGGAPVPGSDINNYLKRGGKPAL